MFGKIAFLDDFATKHDVLGKTSDCARFLGEFSIAIPSIANNELRRQWIKMLAATGFVIPTLISPTATVSTSASISYGTLIEPKIIVGANAHVGHGCIISSGAIIERGTVYAC